MRHEHKTNNACGDAWREHISDGHSAKPVKHAVDAGGDAGSAGFDAPGIEGGISSASRRITSASTRMWATINPNSGNDEQAISTRMEYAHNQFVNISRADARTDVFHPVYAEGITDADPQSPPRGSTPAHVHASLAGGDIVSPEDARLDSPPPEASETHAAGKHTPTAPPDSMDGGFTAEPPTRPEAHLRAAAGGPRHPGADITDYQLLTHDWKIFTSQLFEGAAWHAAEGAKVRRRACRWRRRAARPRRQALEVPGALAHLRCTAGDELPESPPEFRGVALASAPGCGTAAGFAGNALPCAVPAPTAPGAPSAPGGRVRICGPQRVAAPSPSAGVHTPRRHRSR